MLTAASCRVLGTGQIDEPQAQTYGPTASGGLMRYQISLKAAAST